jgi:hypothetical protein
VRPVNTIGDIEALPIKATHPRNIVHMNFAVAEEWFQIKRRRRILF